MKKKKKIEKKRKKQSNKEVFILFYKKIKKEERKNKPMFIRNCGDFMQKTSDRERIDKYKQLTLSRYPYLTTLEFFFFFFLIVLVLKLSVNFYIFASVV